MRCLHGKNKAAVFIAGLFFAGCILGGASGLKADEVEYEKFKGGLGSLIAFGRTRAEMVRQYNAETKSYNSIKKAVDSGQLREGDAASTVKRRYGDPVITLTDDRDSTTKWIYKPAEASFSSNQKIYLTFDENDKLVEWISLQPVEENLPASGN